MKSGFAFVYMDDERDAKDAIRGLDNYEFGGQRRHLRVEWARVGYIFPITDLYLRLVTGLCPHLLSGAHHTRLLEMDEQSCLSNFWPMGKQGDGAIRRREDARRSITKQRPTKTLFVVNFDPLDTRSRDLERHFEPYGKIVQVRIRKNFAFVQYETQEEATKALESTNMTKILDRVITVEYAAREDGEREYGGRRSVSPGSRGRGRRDSPEHGRGRSPGYRQHSRSPPRRYRSRSPDYAPYGGHR